MCEIPVIPEDRYATVPLKIVPPKRSTIDDDVLHASFDAALSERLTALNKRWNSLSSTPAYTTESLFNAQPAIEAKSRIACAAQSVYAWSRQIIYGCLALIFLLIGFDLMGLLVLNTH
jgi:hypothetical protein